MEGENTEVTIKQETKEEVPSVEPNNVTTASDVQVKAESNDVKSEDDVKPKAEPNNEISSDIKPTTDLDDKIIRQVEYYFGDYNLPKDKFLKEQITLDDGWIPITTMLKFARLSQLTKSPQVIMSAIKKSSSGLMEVCESSSKIRRVQPLPEETEERVSEVKARTVYCKGFPKEGMNIDKLLEFFKDFPTVLNVKMRYYKGKDQMGHFKGSITATFSTREEAEKFMTLETVKYNDYTLQRQWSTEWEKEKAEEYEARQNRKSKKGSDENGNGVKVEKDEDMENEDKIVLPRGTILKLVNLPSSIDRDQIKKAFVNYPADIAHVEITPDSTAFVRLRGENDGKLVLTKLENSKISVGDASCDVTLLDGDEEEEYMKKAEEHVNNRANSFKSSRGRGGGRGGGRGRGRGRGGKGRGYKGQKRSGSPSGSRGDKTSKQSRSE